jgi:hypothetical protein
MLIRAAWLSLFGLGLAACSSGGETEGEFFGERVTSFANVASDGEILGVGVVIPVKAFENASADHASHEVFILDMPADVRDETFVRQLRINWLSSGHGPSPYAAPHFDLHFHRGTGAEIDDIDCSDTSAFPPEVLPAGYETPTLCVSRMGYHAWPSEDLQADTFTASMILGYYGKKMVFLEPMVTQEQLLRRETFELAIARPESTGGATTLFPSRVVATYDAAKEAYSIEFNQFSPID